MIINCLVTPIATLPNTKPEIFILGWQLCCGGRGAYPLKVRPVAAPSPRLAVTPLPWPSGTRGLRPALYLSAPDPVWQVGSDLDSGPVQSFDRPFILSVKVSTRAAPESHQVCLDWLSSGRALTSQPAS